VRTLQVFPVGVDGIFVQTLQMNYHEVKRNLNFENEPESNFKAVSKWILSANPYIEY